MTSHESKAVMTRVFRSSGVILSNLKTIDEIPISLFPDESVQVGTESKFNNLINGLREKYGFGVISLGSSLGSINSRVEDRQQRDTKDNYIYGLPYKYLGEIAL